ncbi:hypothetical protein COV11_03875 [Candidatus Woesearchaeota archaeon CG10_big_fil_rev_8_21_14_0_10_30_7]|nr:MAG: hypothetical protein COV11_03875 [Candidatus Woesearchaeota archaeon CG10_big_fil_rev_8_21_14_0_10_30_7]
MIELYDELVALENLEIAFEKASNGKSFVSYVIEFEKKLKENLVKLQKELVSLTYKPLPLKSFVIFDPKTRLISKSDFRDRVVHHALIRVIEPIFDRTFISDSFANRRGKGTLKAVKRFDFFKRKVSKNNSRECFVLKADVKHYFETVNHDILLSLIKKKVTDSRVIVLIERILSNYVSGGKKFVGMPLGNLTSQFFANVYLNELDQFVKHKLKAKYYIRYVDDFVILHENPRVLEDYKHKIDFFLKEKLKLELHPSKCKVMNLKSGVDFLGFRIFYYYKLLRKKNLRKFERVFEEMKKDYETGILDREQVIARIEGWFVYANNANTYKYRRHYMKLVNQLFPLNPEKEVINIKKQNNFSNKVKADTFDYSPRKTLQLFKKRLTIKEISEKRQIKESTVWSHFAKLIEANQFSIWKLLPKEKINLINSKISSHKDSLKEIKSKIPDKSITYDEISCVLSNIKSKYKEKPLIELTNWYQKTHCARKCNQNQINICKTKFNHFTTKNPKLEMKRKDFLNLFNNQMTICILPQKEKEKYITWQEFKTKINATNKTPQNTSKTQTTQKNQS